MSTPPEAGQAPGVALFDLDGTLTRHDTLAEFLWGFALRHPRRWRTVWRVLPAIARYAARRDRGLLKSELIRAVMGGEARPVIEAWAGRFVTRLKTRGAFRIQGLAAVERHRAAGDRLVLLSASPNLYVQRIGELLGFERTVCTEIRWHPAAPADRLDGALDSPNRRGAEKSRCLASLRTVYPGLSVTAYGNSSSDLPHLALADRAWLVNGSKRSRRRARALGLNVGHWI